MTITTMTSITARVAALTEKYGEEALEQFLRQSDRFLRKNEAATYGEWADAMVLQTLGYIDEEEPYWTFVAADIYLHKLYDDAASLRGVAADNVYESFSVNLAKYVAAGLYSPVLVEKYSPEELTTLTNTIVPARDTLFTYIGLKTIIDRYVVRDYSKQTVELPQERFMVIAMILMQDEKDNRMAKVQEAYWAMSNLYMTMATPTLANAGKTHGQLSSCFIDTVDDSLQGIYDSNTDVATLSKFGGGIGVYMGKIRSRGSAIRGFKGASSGVLPWIKQLNNTAVSVDQLGQRQGAIAV